MCTCGGKCPKCKAADHLADISKIQMKLKISQPNDSLEKEADRVAEQIVGTNYINSNIQADNKNKGNETQNRKCSKCKEENEDKEEPIQISRKNNAYTNQNIQVSNEITNGIKNAINSNGEDLNPSTRKFMESRFGYDFSHVRIHDNSQTQELTNSMNARAFTNGSHIFIAEKQLATDKQLIAHELTHVIQQKEMSNSFMERKSKNLVNQVSDSYLIQRTPEENNELEWIGQTVNEVGRIGGDLEFQELRFKPLPRRTPGLVGDVNTKSLIPYGTKVIVRAKDNSDTGWVYIESIEGEKLTGWIAKYKVAYPIPDPDAKLYHIKQRGIGLEKVVKQHEPYHGYSKTGDDIRNLVKAIYIANKVTNGNGVYINIKKNIEATSNASLTDNVLDFIDSYRDDVRPLYQSVELIRGEDIWLPSVIYIDQLKKTGQLKTRSAFLNVINELVKGTGGFLTGLVDGFFSSIIDLFKGIYELGKLIGEGLFKLKEIISIDFVEKAHEIIKVIQDLAEYWKRDPEAAMSEIKQFAEGVISTIKQFADTIVKKFVAEWDQQNPYDKWNFRGYVIGYILAEVLMLIFTDGLATGLKWLGKLPKLLGKLGKIGRIILELFQKLAGRIGKITAEISETVKRLPGEQLQKLDVWIAEKVPIRIGPQLATEGAGGVRLEPVFMEASDAATDIGKATTKGGKVGVSGTGKVTSKVELPLGFTKRQFKRFAKSARRLRKEAKLPDGELVVQGSRVSGTARVSGRNLSDIDVALRVDEATFFDLAEKVLTRARSGTRLRETMLKRIRENGQLSSFDLGQEFQTLRRKLLDSETSLRVQFSVLKKGGKLDTGPFLPLE